MTGSSEAIRQTPRYNTTVVPPALGLTRIERVMSLEPSVLKQSSQQSMLKHNVCLAVCLKFKWGMLNTLYILLYKFLFG